MTEALSQYVDQSKHPLVVQRTVCIEGRRTIPQPPPPPKFSGPVGAARAFKNVRTAINEKRDEYKDNEVLLKSAKVGLNLAIAAGGAKFGATAGMVSLGPPGAVAGALLGAGLALVNDTIWDVGVDKNKESFNEAASDIIASEFRKLEQSEREALFNAPIEQVRDRLLQYDQVFGEETKLSHVPVEQRPELLFQLTKVLERRQTELADIADRSLDRLETSAATVGKRVEAIHTLAQKNNQLIQDVAKQTKNINDRLTSVTGEVHRQGRKLDDVARDVGVVKQLMFTNLPVDQQIKALESGFFRGLNKKQVKARVDELKLIQDRKELGATLEQLAAGTAIVGDVAEILNLPPNVQKGISYAGAAFNIGSAIASGNYLQAVGTAVSLFKKRKDAAAERHKQVMEQLASLMKGQKKILENQEALFKNQQEILKGQKTIFETVVKLGDWLEKHHKTVMDKLHAIHADVIWNRTLIINSYRHSLHLGESFLSAAEHSQKDMSTFEGRRAFYLDQTNRTSFQKCWEHLRAVFTRSDLDPSLYLISMEEDDEDTQRRRDYAMQVYQPILDYFDWVHEGKARGIALQSLLLPSDDVKSTKAKEGIEDGDWTPPKSLHWIDSYLSSLIDPDAIEKYGQVLFGLLDYQPFIRPDMRDFYTLNELTSQVELSSNGPFLLAGYKKTLQVALAQQSLLSGETLFSHLYEHLQLSPDDEQSQDDEQYQRAIKALMASPRIQANFALYLIQTELPKREHNLISYKLTYDGGLSMIPLLGKKWQVSERKFIFPVPESARPEWFKELKKETLEIPLPHPVVLGQGTLLHTPDVGDLLTLSETVADWQLNFASHEWRPSLEPRQQKLVKDLLLYRA